MDATSLCALLWGRGAVVPCQAWWQAPAARRLVAELRGDALAGDAKGAQTPGVHSAKTRFALSPRSMCP